MRQVDFYLLAEEMELLAIAERCAYCNHMDVFHDAEFQCCLKDCQCPRVDTEKDKTL